jgi:hypothetical protein
VKKVPVQAQALLQARAVVVMENVEWSVTLREVLLEKSKMTALVEQLYVNPRRETIRVNVATALRIVVMAQVLIVGVATHVTTQVYHIKSSADAVITLELLH